MGDAPWRGGNASAARSRLAPGEASRAARRAVAATLLLVAAVLVLGLRTGPTRASLVGDTRRQLQTGAASAAGGSASLHAELADGPGTDAGAAAGAAAAAAGAAAAAAATAERDTQPDEDEVEWAAGEAGQLASDASGDEWGPERGPEGRTLQFDVCNGFANQRVALMSGLVLAAELNRTLVLPRLLPDGKARRRRGNDGTVPFSDMYDAEAFMSGVRAAGQAVTAEAPPAAARATTFALGQQAQYVEELRASYAHRRYLKLDCPSFRVPADWIVKHEALVFAALAALRPAGRLASIVGSIEQRLQGLSEGGKYNILHLQAGPAWPAHCTRWNRLTKGLASDNCMNGTESVGESLQLHRVDASLPLVVHPVGAPAGDGAVQGALASLREAKYNVVLRDDALKGVEGLKGLAWEEAALVDFYVALGCRAFIGNSVATPTALLIMERWRGNRFATYYNGGNVPLELFLPLFPMPWVFTYNDWSSGTEYDQMVKAAVTSAIVAARMKSHCMFSGSEEHEMYKWFVSMGVTIIRHEPTWRDAVIKEGLRHREANMERLSHLFANPGTIVGAFLRIDIPQLKEFHQYNYVLFTDCDVFFRRQMKLVDWGVPLPTAIGMGYERFEMFPYNDGVMLWNMPYMSKTNKAFIDWILTLRNGYDFGLYTNLDQGAFNQYYEKEVRGKPISRNFNAMIYHTFRPEARIVHLHGPKPNHYLQWLRTGQCNFKDMCKLGVENGFCVYAEEYSQYAPDWDVAQDLRRLCRNLSAGLWHIASPAPDKT